MGEGAHRRVGLDDLGQGLVFLDHVRVGDIGCRFAGAEHEAGVLDREEALGNQYIADHGQGQGHAENAQHQSLVRQGLDQPAFVPGQQAFAEADVVLLAMLGAAHEQRAERRRQGQRNHH
ncbi:hypothetical protein D9M70_630040 [compost metagenome]